MDLNVELLLQKKQGVTVEAVTPWSLKLYGV